jgi:hypothetical protein
MTHAHLSSVERRIIAARIVPLDQLSNPAVGAIIGEAPGGTDGRHRLPMFPLPPTSAGGRLMAMSELPPGVYLGRLARRNLFDRLPLRWSAKEARTRADALLEWIVGVGARRVVLCGTRVAAAFGVRMSGALDIGGLPFRAIPHPSGRNRLYNDVGARALARDAIRWAADL